MKIFWSRAEYNEEKLEVYPSQRGTQIVITQGGDFFQMDLDGAKSLYDYLGFAIQDAEKQQKGE